MSRKTAVLLCLCSGMMAAVPVSAAGIIGITRGGPDIQVPPSQPVNVTWRYGLGATYQVGPRQAILFCGIRREYGPGVDFEIGTDGVLFDDLSDVRASRAVVLSRNHLEPNPNSHPPGKPAVMVKYPVQGGFFPLGARRVDGSEYEQGGTGFGVASAIGWPAAESDPSGGEVWHFDNPRGVEPFEGDEKYRYFEVQQYAFDGEAFRVAETRKVGETELISGWRVTNRGLSPAIPDGDDLVLGMVAAPLPPSGTMPSEPTGAVLVRWTHRNGRWEAADVIPVTGGDNSFEPSVARDLDGSLLFCVRGGKEPDYNDVRIWRSRDQGRSWEKIIHIRGIVGSTPICLNQATDGSLYVASNIYQVQMHPWPHTYRLPRDRRGNPRGGGWSREALALWPLRADRTGLETPIIARDCRSEFGTPPGGSNWNVDHPMAVNLRLRDGRWHNVMVTRILEYGEIVRQLGPAPQSGAYLEEVHFSGKPVPAWRFAD